MFEHYEKCFHHGYNGLIPSQINSDNTKTAPYWMAIAITILMAIAASTIMASAVVVATIDGIILTDLVNGECLDGIDKTKDGKSCVRADRAACGIDPDNSLCNDQSGSHGHIFCDLYAGLTGSRMAYGGSYDRNDNPEEYCISYSEDKEFCNLIEVRDDDGSITSKDVECILE
jgi:hypothetical protein